MEELSPPVLADSLLVHAHTMISKVGAGAEFSRMQQNEVQKQNMYLLFIYISRSLPAKAARGIWKGAL